MAHGHDTRGTLAAGNSQGEIIAVGPGGRDEAGKLIPIDLKVGDQRNFFKLELWTRDVSAAGSWPCKRDSSSVPV